MTAAFYRTARIPISATGLVLIIVAVTTAIRLWLGASLELHFDEAYYRYWSKNLQLAYFDHPPAVAWLIRAGTGIFGDNELGVRITGQICVLIALWFLYDAARRIFSLNAALIAVVSTQATLLLGAGSIIMAPDAPLMLFTTTALWALIRLCLDADPGWWLIAGEGAIHARSILLIGLASSERESDVAANLLRLASPRFCDIHEQDPIDLTRGGQNYRTFVVLKASAQCGAAAMPRP